VSKWRVIRRWLLWSLLFLVFAPPLAVLGLLASDGGSAWLLQQLASAARGQGIEVRFAGSTGNLLRRLEIAELGVQAADARIDAQRVLLAWRPRALFERRLHVEALEIDALRVAPPPPAADSEPTPPQIPDLALPLAVQIDRLDLAGVTIVQPGGDVVLEKLALSAALDKQGLHIGDLEFAMPGAHLGGELSLAGSAPHTLQGRLSARIEQRLTGDDIGPVEAVATLSGTALQPGFELSLQAPAELRVQGALQLEQLQPGLDLSADWRELNWPPQGTTVVSTANGRLNLRGTAEDYHLDLRARLQLPDLPAADLGLQARGDLGGLTLAPLSLQMQDARLQADGDVRWEQGVSWRLALLAERLNPGLLQPEWPGSIDGRVQFDGSLGPEGMQTLTLSAQIADLGGSLRGYPVSARGGVDWRAGQLIAEALQLASGPNRVDVDGRAGERLDLQFDINAPDLASLYPGLSGNLQGKGRLAGTPDAPALSVELQSSALAFEEQRVQALELSIDWTGQSGQGRLQVSGLVAGGTTLNTVSAAASGSLDAHRLDLQADGPDVAVSLSAQGGLREQVWQGALQGLSLKAPALDEWNLQAPADLLLGADQAKTDGLCLTRQGAELCASGGWEVAEGLDLAGRLHGLDLARLAPYLPGDAIVEGSLGAEFSVKGQPADPAVVLDVRPSDGHIRLEEAEQPFDLAFRNARISARFAEGQGAAELGLEIGENGRASGRVTLGAEQAGQRALGGEIKAEFPDLNLIAGFVPALEAVQGSLQADIALGGTLTGPQLRGGLQITDAQARVPEAGILLSDIDLAVQSDGAAPLQLKGQVQSGEGRIALDGSIDLAAAGGPAVDLGIRGEAFEAVRVPEVLLLVSPDLRIQGNAPYRLSGTLRIPRATIELQELPSGTVSVSDDEIVIGEQVQDQPAAASRNLDAKVRVELGDKVTFEGFGLRTGLSGAVDATVDARGTIVDGKIELRDGAYKAYGQDLTIERGRIIFAGPAANPDVDLRAVRVSKDGEVKAYLGLSGPLAEPQTQIYSEPALPEAEALAYLLTGRGLDQAGQQEGSAIAGAAMSLGLSKSEPLLQDMSDRLGLDELRIEEGAGGLEDGSLVLGKYLNPDLYLGYAQGLFNPEGAVLLRLRLSDKIDVESRSGIQQSVDLFYRLEHD
jgi:translocation and assembly module TamB